MIGNCTPPPFICQETEHANRHAPPEHHREQPPKTREEREIKAQQSLKRGGVAVGGAVVVERDWKRRASEERMNAK